MTNAFLVPTPNRFLHALSSRGFLGVIGFAAASAAGSSNSAVESADDRAALPEYQTIPAEANPTPTDEAKPASAYRTWTVSHGDAGSRRYSALDQINRSNVKDLKEAWTYHSNDGHAPIQCNPIVVDGVMYAPTAGRALVALAAATGKELWRFQLDKPARLGLYNSPARRGLVYWPGEGAHGPRIVFGCDFWIYALDPKTGRPIAEFGQNGRAPLPTGQAAVGAIWQKTYIVPGVFGDVYSFDLETGAQLWRFHTIPRPGEFGAETWPGPIREGGNPWGGLALDEQRAIVYVSCGNPWPSSIGTGRLGDDLFSNCLVALDTRTGRRLWHFQNVRHDLWDLDNPAPPNLVTITRNGRRVDAVICVNKPGDTVLLDRVTGQPIFPFRLRRAPVSTVPGEATAPYQPDPEWPAPISNPEFKIDDITNRTPAAHDYVLAMVKKAALGFYQPPTLASTMLYHSSRGGAEWTGACIDVPTGRMYVNSNHIANLVSVVHADEMDDDPTKPPSAGKLIYLQDCAGCHQPTRMGGGMVPPLIGLQHRLSDDRVLTLLETGRNTMPPAPPLTGQQRHDLLDYIMRRHQPLVPRSPSLIHRGDEFAGSGTFLNDQDGYPGCKPPWGQLNCIDLNTGKMLWRVTLGEYPELTKLGLPATGTENFGGPAVTAGGLVFCSGTRDLKIRAFDKDTGEELWAAKLPYGGFAPPSIYEVDGKEYVVIAAAGGGVPGLKAGSLPTGDAYVAFALP